MEKLKEPVIKLGIGREIFSLRDLETINEHPEKSHLINDKFNEKIEDEKERISESIFLAIKDQGLINFEVKDNILYGSLKIDTSK